MAANLSFDDLSTALARQAERLGLHLEYTDPTESLAKIINVVALPANQVRVDQQLSLDQLLLTLVKDVVDRH